MNERSSAAFAVEDVDLGRYLKHKREAMHITQAEAAQRAGVPVGRWSMMESKGRKTLPPPTDFHALCRGVHHSPRVVLEQLGYLV